MSDPLIEVDRAISELRRGALIRIVDGSHGILLTAIEALSAEAMEHMRSISRGPVKLLMTGARMNALGIDHSERKTSVITHPNGLTLAAIEYLVNPLAPTDSAPDLNGIVVSDADSLDKAGITLTKLSRLLPAALAAQGVGEADTLSVHIDAIEAYMNIAAESLTLVSEARVPLEGAENARIMAFRPRDGGIEHLAIVIGEIDSAEPVLVRLHSECFTGDLMGSLRCDCGNQLRGAIQEMARSGSGILLYLAQEGRGIGLVNKLRAYQLQDLGFDTVDANLQLGFDSDERNYLPAAQMLRVLGVSRVRLMTNNPLKVKALGKCGIEVSERVPHIYPSNKHNDGYLRVKAAKSGHLFEF